MRNNLKRLRLSRDYSVRRLAEELEIHYSLISYWENGKRTPCKENKKKLEVFFKRPIEFLLEESV